MPKKAPDTIRSSVKKKRTEEEKKRLREKRKKMEEEMEKKGIFKHLKEA